MPKEQIPEHITNGKDIATYPKSNTSDREVSRLKRFFYARLIGSLTLLLIFSWLTQNSNEALSISLPLIFFLWLSLTLAQVILFRYSQGIVGNLLFQLTADLMLIGLMIYNTGGIKSPLIFLLGVIIIIAGTQARVLLVLTTAILASATYLSVIHLFARHHQQVISNEHTLLILLQISLFFLTGGIMAIIARRHSNLQQEQQHTTIQHYRLQELHSQLMNTMKEAILILDKHLTIQDFNPSASKILGIKITDKVKYNLYNFLTIPSEMLNFIGENDLDTFQTELHLHHKTLLITLTRLLEGESTWLMTIIDITKTRKLEQQLAEQDKLASIGQMAALLAHEIRNPMQTIAQAVELMGLESQNTQLEQIVTHEISRLNRLVSDMLDYASPLHPHIQLVDIKSLIQTSISQIDLTNQHDIQINVPNQNIHLDPDHFRLVLDNLLRNALAFSLKPASIQITFDGLSKGWVLKIRDHGEGISEEVKKTLFEPFQTGREHGTGLGLATVWQVCHANHWSIHIDEIIQDGACFIITNNERLLHNGEKRG